MLWGRDRPIEGVKWPQVLLVIIVRGELVAKREEKELGIQGINAHHARQSVVSGRKIGPILDVTFLTIQSKLNFLNHACEASSLMVVALLPIGPV